MNRIPRPARYLAALLGAAAIAGATTQALATPAAPREPTRHSFEVISATIYVASAGAAKGSMQARVRARYRFTPALPGEKWIGVTTMTMKGPGGSKTVRDRDRLLHLAAGQPVDHRMPISRAEAARILGPRPKAAKVRVFVRGHLEMQGQGANEALNVYGMGLIPGFGGYLPPMYTTTFPPSARVWGAATGNQFAVQVTDNAPFRPYVSYVYVMDTPVEPAYLPNDDPATGFIQADNTFALTGAVPNWPCSGPTSVTGSVPPGARPTGPAVVSLTSCMGNLLPYPISP